jgi:hypothetical protein
MSDQKSTSGKLIFSNPPQANSAFSSEMKSLTEVPAFADHVHASNKAKSFNTPQVAVYSVAADIVVTPGNPLIITGAGPVKVAYGKVTIQPGGQILVYTAADITIDTLIKE